MRGSSEGRGGSQLYLPYVMHVRLSRGCQTRLSLRDNSNDV